MKKIRIRFHEIVQGVQEIGSQGDHMVSRLKFSAEVDGKVFNGLEVDVQQPHGTNYANEPLEVKVPMGGYSGPWNHQAFADLCEHYYRKAIGSASAIIAIGPGAINVKMSANRFTFPFSGEFEANEESHGAW